MLDDESRPYLDEQLIKIKKIDDKILWFENKLKETEEEKQKALAKMTDLLELAVVSTHKLQNGFTVKPANTRGMKVKDVSKFLKWMKENKKPFEVMEFFKTSIKVDALKKFCMAEADYQRTCGIMEPQIDGVDLGEITFRRLTTSYK